MGKAARRMLLALALVTACCAVESAVAYAQEVADEDPPPPEPKPVTPPSTIKVLLTYGLAIGGFGVCVIGFARTLGGVSYQQSRLMITNMLRTNPNQAEQMMHQTKGMYFEGLAAALKLAAMTQSRDPKTVSMTTPPAYDAAASQVGMYWKGLIGKIKLAAMALVGAVVLAATQGIGPVIPVILMILGLAGFIRLHLYKGEVERDFTRARMEVLPEVDRAIIDGRYWFPAPPPG